MSVMSAIVFAVTRDSGSSPPIGLVQPQYLPALAQSRLLQLRFAASPSESSSSTAGRPRRRAFSRVAAGN